MNPVKRGLVTRPEQWPWSSFRHYASGVEGIVEIESQWTARKRERLGLTPHILRRELPSLSQRTRQGWGTRMKGYREEMGRPAERDLGHPPRTWGTRRGNGSG